MLVFVRASPLLPASECKHINTTETQHNKHRQPLTHKTRRNNTSSTNRHTQHKKTRYTANDKHPTTSQTNNIIETRTQKVGFEQSWLVLSETHLAIDCHCVFHDCFLLVSLGGWLSCISNTWEWRGLEACLDGQGILYTTQETYHNMQYT